MPSSTASSTPRTALPSTARPCANHRKKLPSVESLTLTPPSEPLKLSMGATVRDHRNAVRDRSESLSAIDRNDCPHSPESATGIEIRHGGTRAYYAEGPDYVQMPPFETFRDAESFAATLAHEACHWTKHS